jgi:hypothetical protein
VADLAGLAKPSRSQLALALALRFGLEDHEVPSAA